MSSPAARANAVTFHAFHGSSCPRVVVLKKGPCRDPDGLSPSRMAGWPVEWAVDEDILGAYPQIAKFAGRTCLEVWRHLEQAVERN